MKRRTLLKGTLAAGAVGVAVSSGLLTPRSALAAWPKDAFKATTLDEALNALLGQTQLENTDKIDLSKIPALAESSKKVPITVNTSIDGIESISVMIPNNPNPLIASYDMGNTLDGYISFHCKMAKTSPVIVVVKANGKLYSAQKEVKVTIGGCGG